MNLRSMFAALGLVLTLASAGLDAGYYRNQALPQLNLELSGWLPGQARKLAQQVSGEAGRKRRHALLDRSGAENAGPAA